MKIKFPKIIINNHSLFFFKKIFLFYLIISNSVINSGITIFPDHYEHDDEIFSTSQVKDVTFERFYYSIGYFTNLDIEYISPKYGITYHPVQCVPIPVTGSIEYKNNDRTSFFYDEGKPIRFPDSTRSNLNKIEETKLYQNTLTGNNIRCPSPFLLFHNKYFTITLRLPIISNENGDNNVDVILNNEDSTLNKVICSVTLSKDEFNSALVSTN